jgi:hypothetical protein
LAKSAA